VTAADKLQEAILQILACSDLGHRSISPNQTMQRFKNTFDAHPQHTREQKPEHTLYAIYPILRAFYPVYQKYLESADINPAERVWIREQMELFHRRDQELGSDDDR